MRERLSPKQQKRPADLGGPFSEYFFHHSRAGDRTRTGDVQLGKLAFYQLNYTRSTTNPTPKI
jgi:hypothetical protein